MASITWIKLSVNLFDDEKIKLIRSMPEGDKVLLIWIQLLCMAGKVNDKGAVYVGQNMYYTDEMLSTITQQPLNIIRLAIQTFINFEMVDVDEDGLIQIENWEKHQNIDGMEKIRDQNRLRKQKQRERERLKALEDSHVKSRDSHATDKNRIDKNRIDKDNNSPLEKDDAPYEEIIRHLNSKSNKNFRHSTPKNKELIRARWNEGFTLDDFKKVIDNKVSDWLGTDYENYIRPVTLFSNKFESYLNENPKPKKAQGYLKPYDDEENKKYIEKKLKSADFMPRRD